MRNLRITIIIFLGSFLSLKAQDVHFSNYNAQPMLLNPALTGLNGCDYRIGGNFRTQWLGVSEGNTYRTASLFGDVALGKPTKNSNFAGIGVSLLSDQAGDLNYNTNKVDVSFAYHIMLAKQGKQSLSIGLQAGFAHRGFDQSRALFQFDPLTGAPVLSAVESFDSDTRFYGDAGLGFLYSNSPTKTSNFFFGLGLQHINQPNISSFNINRDQSERMFMKFTAHAGGLIPLGQQLGLMPGVLFLRQGTTFEANVSTFLKYKFSSLPSKTNAVYFGMMYRVQDAFIISTRADLGGFQIHFSYDLNVSKLTNASNGNGGPELALIYTGCFKKKNKSQRYCPEF